MIPVLLLFALMQGEICHPVRADGHESSAIVTCPYTLQEWPEAARVPPPIDVPAIEEEREQLVTCQYQKEGCELHGVEGMFLAKNIKVKYPTCADKTRILQHDEQTPPKYWCHRVQP